jgi:hypothetical protein
MLRDGQWRQVNVQPEPVLGKVVLQHPTLTTKKNFAALSQLCYLWLGKSIQGAR